MFRGAPWFAWYPVVVSDNGRSRLAWLETVWRDQALNQGGTVAATRYYTR